LITSTLPEQWQDLEAAVADLLKKCGMAVEISHCVSTVRGDVVVDVHAIDTAARRNTAIFCECKHWRTPVPKTVVHAFRTVVSDGGANVGYLISSAGFQSESVAAAETSNVRLRTWPEFQVDFEPLYIANHFRPEIHRIVDPLCTFVEPLFLARGPIPDENMRAFRDLVDEYETFAFICMEQFPYMDAFSSKPMLLPLSKSYPNAKFPAKIANVDSYGPFLQVAEEVVSEAISEFRALLSPSIPGSVVRRSGPAKRRSWGEPYGWPAGSSRCGAEPCESTRPPAAPAGASARARSR
jgi:restriction system protein